YLAGVSVVGLTALVVAQVRLGPEQLAHVLGLPLLWMLTALVVLGELRPVVMSSSTLVGGTPASVMFSFAVLLHYGLSVAVLTQAAAIVVSGLVHRRAWHRTAFNVAHVTLACTAGAVVLGAFGVL